MLVPGGRRYVGRRRPGVSWGGNVGAAATAIGAAGYRYFTGPTRKRKRVHVRRTRRIMAPPRYFRRFVRFGKKTSLKKKVAKLTTFMNQQQALHIHRQRDASTLRSSEKTLAKLKVSAGGNLTDVQNSVANLRFYDPATNALVTKDVASGTYARDMIISINRRLIVKNNYQVPCYIRIYDCYPKVDTGLSVEDCFDDALLDQGNPSNTSPLVFLSDCLQLRDMWSCKCVYKGVLGVGKTVVRNSFSRDFQYDFNVVDEHAVAFQRRYGGHNWFITLTGCLAHDNTVATEQGIAQGGIDYIHDTVYKIKYDAGKDLKDISINDNSDTFTTLAVQSNKPRADNQPYEIA